MLFLATVAVLLAGLGPGGAKVRSPYRPIVAASSAARTGTDAAVGAAASPAGGSGYDLVASDGGVFSFATPYHGSAGGLPLSHPMVGTAATADGGGYWLVASDGGIFAYGDARFAGSTGALHLNRPIVGIAADPATGGYWLVASDGGIFAFGAPFHGSAGAVHLTKPIVGMASTADGGGYWLVASDGGIFAYGDARFAGSTGALHLNRPIVGMAADPATGGYWLVASDGGIFAFGAPFHGSAGGLALAQPIVGISATPTGDGYRMVASDGGIFSYGAASFLGSTGGIRLARPIVGMTIAAGMAPAPLGIATTSLTTSPAACVVGSVCLASVNASGGQPPYTWTVAPGSALPPGLSLSPGGSLSGVPSQPGSFGFELRVTDADGMFAARSFSLTIGLPTPPFPAIGVGVPSGGMPDGIVGLTYPPTSLFAVGGTAPYVWSVAASTPMPPGLSLSAQGVISGTPTLAGQYAPTVTATDSLGRSGSADLSITVGDPPPLSVATTSLPSTTIYQGYVPTRLQAAGGAGTDQWAVAPGSSLPPGLTLSSDGVVSGRARIEATSSFEVQVTDSVHQAAQATVAVAVLPPESTDIVASLPPAPLGQPYDASLAATLGATPYTWSIVSGTLPVGLRLSTDGVITGTPVVAGTQRFTAAVSDAGGVLDSATLSIGVTSSCQLSVVAGTAVAVIPGPAAQAQVLPSATATDAAGNVFIADSANRVIEEVTPGGSLSIVVGQVGQPGPVVAGPAFATRLSGPSGLAFDPSGNLEFLDGGVLAELTPSGMITLLASGVSLGHDVQGLAIDGSGDRFVADRNDSLIIEVSAGGIVSAVAGDGSAYGPVPGPALASPIGQPDGVAVDGTGALYVADDGNRLVEKVDAQGNLSVIAGVAGGQGLVTPGPATASPLGALYGIAVDAAGDVYVAEDGGGDILEVTPAGLLSIVAGRPGYRGPATPGPATGSDLGHPSSVAAAADGTLTIGDSGDRGVERVTPNGTLSIVAGPNSNAGFPIPPGPSTSFVHAPQSVAVDGSGDIYAANPYDQVVEKQTPSGTLSIVAGEFDHSGTPTPGPATSSKLTGPYAVAIDGAGDLYISDDALVLKVTPDGTLSVIAGMPGIGGPPTPGPATGSALGFVRGLALDASGDLYLADESNGLIERVTPDGTLSIVAGTVGRTGAPVPGAATASPLGAPYGVAVDPSGDVFIADATYRAVERVDSSGNLTVIAGELGYGFPIPGPASESPLDVTGAIAADGSGDVYVATGGVYDNTSPEVVKISPSDDLTFAAGNGTIGPPSPGVGLLSPLAQVEGLAVDASGDLFVADVANQQVDEVTSG